MTFTDVELPSHVEPRPEPGSLEPPRCPVCNRLALMMSSRPYCSAWHEREVALCTCGAALDQCAPVHARTCPAGEYVARRRP